MSETDSFIDEVNEEVQRDHLYRMMRKYGWIAVALVLVLVGGAAYNEFRKASAQTAAQALGDSILAAETQEDADARLTALSAINAEGDAQAIANFLAAANGSDGAEKLRVILADASVAPLYQDLATFKLATLENAGVSQDEAVELLSSLTMAGGAFRVLAEEQLALVELEGGDVDAAMTRLQLLLQDDEASGALRRRATQLIVALGGTPELS